MVNFYRVQVLIEQLIDGSFKNAKHFTETATGEIDLNITLMEGYKQALIFIKKLRGQNRSVEEILEELEKIIEDEEE